MARILLLLAVVCLYYGNVMANDVALTSSQGYDINECEENEDVCGENADCIDTNGSFACQCHQGFFSVRGGKTCYDIDECHKQIYNCTLENQSVCMNTLGSYICLCDEGSQMIGGKCVGLRAVTDKATTQKTTMLTERPSVATMSTMPSTTALTPTKRRTTMSPMPSTTALWTKKRTTMLRTRQTTEAHKTKDKRRTTVWQTTTMKMNTRNRSCPLSIRHLSAGPDGFAVLPLPGQYGIDYNISFPPGEYPVTAIVESTRLCKILLKVFSANLRRRLEFEAQYKANCSAVLNPLNANLINSIADTRYDVIQHLCAGACERQSAAIKPVIACADSVMTVRWPTDLTLQGDQVEAPTSLRLKTYGRLMSKTPLLDLVILTAKPPVVYPERTADGSIAKLKLTPYCLKGHYDIKQDDCIN